MLKDYLIALSMANLWFLDIWKLFLIRHDTAYPYYHWKANPAPLLLATTLDVLLLSVVLFVAITLVRRSRKQSILTIARVIFVLVCLLLLINFMLLVVNKPPLGPFVRTLKERPQVLFEWRGVSTVNFWVATVVILGSWLGISLIVHSLIFRRHQLTKRLATIVLILSPFALITFSQAAVQWIRFYSGKQFQENTVAALSQERTSPRRILWLVFDELDARLSFAGRPAALELPEFDRLRHESFFANNAYPPSGDTVDSIPALINGRLVSSINRIAPNELELTYSDGITSRWSAEPNIFSRARSMGFNTALAGWYHPYCRIIGKNLTKCSWEAANLLFLDNSEIGDLLSNPQGPSVKQSMLRIGGSILPEITWFLFPKAPSEWRKHPIQEFNRIHQQALDMAADSNVKLILIHYPIPHPPGIYDRYKNEFSLSRTSGYLDNLALADRVLGQLRNSMTDAGVWDTTTVLVTSDHSLRGRLWKKHPIWQSRFAEEDPAVLNSLTDERVPFILKLAGENTALTYEPAFNTVLSHDLILAILSGEISKPEQALAWLDSHRSIAKSPYGEK